MTFRRQHQSCIPFRAGTFHAVLLLMLAALLLSGCELETVEMSPEVNVNNRTHTETILITNATAQTNGVAQ
jgi:PBP1b-binding outer membrane lipoprotein LpoB